MPVGLDVGFVGGVDPLPRGVGPTVIKPVPVPVPVLRIIAACLSNPQVGAQNITAPVAGNYRLVLVGPGGGGAVALPGSPTNSYLTGGSTGGVTVSKSFAMTAGQSISVTLGSGGTAITRNTAGTSNGNPGSGPTTATLPDGTVLSAGAGLGGQSVADDTVAGPAGGAASGGEFNYTGGSGGKAGQGGPRETITVNGVTFQLGGSSGVQDFSFSPRFIGGGGNTPTANGLIPLAVGSDGVAKSGSQGTSFVADPPRNSPGIVGRGGGSSGDNNAAASGGSGSATSGPGGHGGAFLILEPAAS